MTRADLSFIAEALDKIYMLSDADRHLPDNKFIRIEDFKESAVSRFGNDPEFFRIELKNYKVYSVNCLKNIMIGFSSRGLNYNLRYYINYLVSIYQSCLIAILQVDFECPGFIENFEEAIDYKLAADIHDTNYVLQKQINRLDDIKDRYNRYSKRFDFKYLISTFNITDKNLENKERRYDKLRVDDWVAMNFINLLNTTKDPKIISYLKTNFSINRDLLPPDYRMILSMLMKEEDFKKLKYKEKSLKWIDYYFDNQDKLLENLKYSDLSPEIIKMINYTLMS